MGLKLKGLRFERDYWRHICLSLSGIKIPENCVVRVREELLQMDEEVKKKRREREQQAIEQRKMENRHLLANLFNQKIILNKVQSLTQNQFPKQKLSQSVSQRTQSGSISQLPRVPTLPESTLQQPPQTMSMQPLQRNPCQVQQRTHNWPTTSTNHHGLLSNPANHASSLQPQFHPQHFFPHFPHMKNSCVPPHQKAPSPSLSSIPLDEILDLTVSSPSPSPDTTEGRPSLDSLTRHSSAFGDDFNLESLISMPGSTPQPAAQLQQPLLPQQQQQQNHNMLANIHEGFDLSLCPQMSTQNPNPSSSNSSGSSLTPSSPALFSSPSSTSLFSSSFPTPYIHPQSDPLHPPNGHCGANPLDVREALNSMLQDGHDRKSVIQYRHQDWGAGLEWFSPFLLFSLACKADCVLFAAVCDRTIGPTPSPLRAFSHVTACWLTLSHHSPAWICGG